MVKENAFVFFVSFVLAFFSLVCLSLHGTPDYTGYEEKKWNPHFLDLMMLINLFFFLIVSYLVMYFKEPLSFNDFMLLDFLEWGAWGFILICLITFIIFRLTLRRRMIKAGYEVHLVQMDSDKWRKIRVGN